MDGLEFIEKVVGHIVTLAWPAVLVYFLFTQRAALTKVIESLRIKSFEGFGAKIEMLDAAVADAVVESKEAPQIAHAPGADSAPAEADVRFSRKRGTDDDADATMVAPPKRVRMKWRDAASTSPVVIIENAWADVLLEINGLLNPTEKVKGWWELQNVPDAALLSQLAGDGRLGHELFMAVFQLMRIRNDATSGVGWQPTLEEARRYQANAETVARLIATTVHAGMPKEPVARGGNPMGS